MRIIRLDASKWTNNLDFYEALLPQLGAPDWHGESIAALIDSMIWGEINEVEPPYRVQVVGTDRVPSSVMAFLEDLRDCLRRARADRLCRMGVDADATLELFP